MKIKDNNLGGVQYFKNLKYNGAAEINCDGSENTIPWITYFKNGVLHREDGPAFEYVPTKMKRWILNGWDCSYENGAKMGFFKRNDEK
jgi:hypothetical protein